MTTTLIPEEDPFPRWLRWMFPELARLDQNPVLAATLDLERKTAAAKPQRQRWKGRIIFAGLVLAAWWATSWKDIPGLIFIALVVLGAGAYTDDGSVSILDNPELPRPVFAKDFLDAVFGSRVVVLRHIVVGIFLLGGIVFFACVFGISSENWVKWPCAIIFPWLILALFYNQIWNAAGRMSIAVVFSQIVQIGKYACDPRFASRAIYGVTLRFGLLFGFLFFAASAGLLTFAVYPPNGDHMGIAFFALTIPLCIWMTFFSRAKEKAALRYRVAVAALNEVLPISMRTVSEDIVAQWELDRLLMLVNELRREEFKLPPRKSRASWAVDPK